MTTSTLGIKIAKYAKAPYALYGYRSAKTGQYCVSMTKGHGRNIKWVEYNRFETQDAATRAFMEAKTRLDAMVENFDRKRSIARDERSEAIKTYKETTANP